MRSMATAQWAMMMATAHGVMGDDNDDDDDDNDDDNVNDDNNNDDDNNNNGDDDDDGNGDFAMGDGATGHEDNDNGYGQQRRRWRRCDGQRS